MRTYLRQTPDTLAPPPTRKSHCAACENQAQLPGGLRPTPFVWGRACRPRRVAGLLRRPLLLAGVLGWVRGLAGPRAHIMDGDDAGPRRASCPRCGRPTPVCLCHALPDSPLPNSVRHLIVLTHPAELKRALTSTSQLLPQLLERSTTIVGRLFRPGDHPVLDKALARRDTLLLFPRAGAYVLQPQGLSDAASEGVTAETSGDSGRERLDAFVAHAWARQAAEERALALLPRPPQRQSTVPPPPPPPPPPFPQGGADRLLVRAGPRRRLIDASSHATDGAWSSGSRRSTLTPPPLQKIRRAAPPRRSAI
eukprot:COSAG04_NODE_3874_length_2458_cov_2.643917_2_plen_309_part_00